MLMGLRKSISVLIIAGQMVLSVSDLAHYALYHSSGLAELTSIFVHGSECDHDSDEKSRNPDHTSALHKSKNIHDQCPLVSRPGTGPVYSLMSGSDTFQISLHSENWVIPEGRNFCSIIPINSKARSPPILKA
jgi:hypothetical protein